MKNQTMTRKDAPAAINWTEHRHEDGGVGFEAKYATTVVRNSFGLVGLNIIETGLGNGRASTSYTAAEARKLALELLKKADELDATR